ncbi:hypothetical protein G5B88_04455 [Herbaspirillum seropedicae]|uniref:Uncharacterized protein n=1 Tax=Herbaspirillum seropedicae (strain SmR1) TaxID=757424 RepID=D8J060_HERSS|nr:hypothetical protein [Herbaspirillum seropedicae]ADJ62397.1 hypothetical protein Hsero_0880 [Herbaspirillum seropedicae SmR1]AKN64530.1 hypothetical protein ACP92_04410 [Herbaspirillum seropedicae]NQE31049.1 hypothetical protein [Herbaspirillum seropedicae]UMU20468.1 hypothetical protein G5B88_04455 [Herbaspirillum seropedicae]
MPDIELTQTSPELIEALKKLMVIEGFESIEDAAEFIFSVAVREGAKRVTGKARVLYAVQGKKPCA